MEGKGKRTPFPSEGAQRRLNVLHALAEVRQHVSVHRVILIKEDAVLVQVKSGCSLQHFLFRLQHNHRCELLDEAAALSLLPMKEHRC